MLRTKATVKSLYPLALAEGEGVGTAYEYLAKRLVLSRWLRRRIKNRPVKRILLPGIPEKYGVSLNILDEASRLGASMTVLEDRPAFLTKARKALKEAQAIGEIVDYRPAFQQVVDLTDLPADYQADLVVSSEVIQRFEPEKQRAYLAQIVQRAPLTVLYIPNGDNEGHTTHSGLNGLTLAELQILLADLGLEATTGYIDMPPFPPGIVRSEDQREQAQSGLLEAVAMWGLGWVVRAENLIPRFIRRKQSHIVYAFIER